MTQPAAPQVTLLLLSLPAPTPHAEADEGEDDDDERGGRGSDGDRQNLAVQLALGAVVVTGAGAHPLPRLDGAGAAAGAVVGRAGLALSSLLARHSGRPVTVAGQAGAAKPSEMVDALAVLTAVVELWLGTLVEVLHPRDRVERSRYVQITAS